VHLLPGVIDLIAGSLQRNWAYNNKPSTPESKSRSSAGGSNRARRGPTIPFVLRAETVWTEACNCCCIFASPTFLYMGTGNDNRKKCLRPPNTKKKNVCGSKSSLWVHHRGNLWLIIRWCLISKVWRFYPADCDIGHCSEDEDDRAEIWKK